MVLNLGKCTFMLFGVKNELQTDFVPKNVTMKNSKEEKFDNKLDFSWHLTRITKKANTKLKNLTRVQKYIIWLQSK